MICSLGVQPLLGQSPDKTQTEPSGPELNAENVEAWRDHIRPSSEELAWTQIDWHRDLKSGLEDATKSGKPILLWTMNGHPFGCT